MSTNLSPNLLIGHISAIEPITAGDGCHLRELLQPTLQPLGIGYSLAHASIEPGGRTIDHWLAQSEVYYIIAGVGTMFLDDIGHAVQAGTYYYVPPRCRQWLRNDGDTRIEFLCIVDPSWTSDGETIVDP